MKAYKATYNFKCRNQEYKVGKTYTSDKMQMCGCGIHFCPRMEDVVYYYTPKDDLIILEIEVLGETEFEDDKGVTNKIKVLRVVPFEEYPEKLKNKWPVFEYDSNGNVIFATYPNGGIYKWEYDSNGNKIFEKYSDGSIRRWEYDTNGNRISEKCLDSVVYRWEYDSNGNVISETYPNGVAIRYEYDSNGNKISDIYPDGWVVRYEVATITESDS